MAEMCCVSRQPKDSMCACHSKLSVFDYPTAGEVCQHLRLPTRKAMMVIGTTSTRPAA